MLRPVPCLSRPIGLKAAHLELSINSFYFRNKPISERDRKTGETEETTKTTKTYGYYRTLVGNPVLMEVKPTGDDTIRDVILTCAQKLT